MRRTAALGALITIIALAGCTVREELVLSGDGSGTAELTVDLHPIMIDYMNDLVVAMTGVEGDYPIFDLDQLRASFAERDGVTILDASLPSRGMLVMNIAFDDVNALLAREGAADVLRLERRGANRELMLRLDAEAVQRFLAFAPPESASMAQFLLPPADGSVSQDEYREELAWALEEYEDAATVRRVLDRSVIEVRVTPVGRIVSQRGGRIDGDAVVFSVPILEVLTLPTERTYSLVFAP